MAKPPLGHIELDPLDRIADRVVAKLKPQLTAINSNLRKLIAMDTKIDDEIATETVQEKAMADAVATNTTTLQTIQKQLADALDASKNAGATPDQLAAFDAIHAKVSADLAALTAADQPTA